MWKTMWKTLCGNLDYLFYLCYIHNEKCGKLCGKLFSFII